MKKIFIYYSLSGNGDFISMYLRNKGIDTRKVVESKKMPKPYFLRLLVGGYRATRNMKTELFNFDKNIDNYDEIIIGSPIWNSRLTPAINSVLDLINLENKKVTFVLYSGSGTSKKATEKIKSLYKEASIIDLRDPLNNADELKKLDIL